MACKGWLGNATSTCSSGIVAAAFHSTATNAKSYKTQLKSFEVYCQSFLHFVRALICFGKPSRLTNPMWCDFFFQQPLHIVTTSWMILSNAGHGLQRLARKRNFHRLVWHSGCCLLFNGHKREILQDTIEVIWSLLSILPAFCEGTYLFWKAKSVDKPYVMWLLLSAAIARSYY